MEIEQSFEELTQSELNKIEDARDLTEILYILTEKIEDLQRYANRLTEYRGLVRSTRKQRDMEEIKLKKRVAEELKKRANIDDNPEKNAVRKTKKNT